MIRHEWVRGKRPKYKEDPQYFEFRCKRCRTKLFKYITKTNYPTKFDMDSRNIDGDCDLQAVQAVMST